MSPILLVRRFLPAAVVVAAALTASASDIIPRPATSGESRPKGSFTSLEFPGGSLADLIAALNKTDVGVVYNLITDGSDEGTKLPAFSLHNSDVSSLSQALNALLRMRDFSLQYSGYGSDSGRNIFVVTKNPIGQAKATLNTGFQPFQIGQYLETVSVDDIMDAIRAGCEFGPGHDGKVLEFKFHPATKILFVSGPPEAITITGQVIAQLKPPPYVSSRGLQIMAPPSADEAVRLQDWQQEIERRRAQRGQTGAPLPTIPAVSVPSTPAKK